MSLLKLERLMNTVFSFHFYVTQFSSLHVNNHHYKIQIGHPVSKTFCFSFFFPFKYSVEIMFLRSCAYHNWTYFKKQMDYLSWRQVFSTIMFVHALVLFILDGLVPVINSFWTKKKIDSGDNFNMHSQHWRIQTKANNYDVIAQGDKFNGFKKQQITQLNFPRTAWFFENKIIKACSESQSSEIHKKIQTKEKLSLFLSSMF